jgi:hypothetical protein
MLAAVKLDDEAGVWAEEVGDVRADPDLPAEFEAEQAAAAEGLPEDVVRRRGLAAEGSGAFQCFRAVCSAHRVPSPSHRFAAGPPLSR